MCAAEAANEFLGCLPRQLQPDNLLNAWSLFSWDCGVADACRGTRRLCTSQNEIPPAPSTINVLPDIS